MQYTNFTIATLCAITLAAPVFAADPVDLSWDGFYAGLSVDAQRTTAGITNAPSHNRKTQSAVLGAYAGFNRTAQSGLIWGAELGLSSLETGITRGGDGLGTTEFKGNYLLNPRARAGVALGNAFLYGTLGAGITNAHIATANTNDRQITMGVSYGLGAEFKLSQGWSTRVDVSRVDLGASAQTFGGQTRDTKIKVDKVTFGLTKRF